MLASALAGRPREGAMSAPAPATSFLHSGQVFVTATPQRIVTIVGSCVSVCVWEPRRRVGGINHFVLPHPPRVSRAPVHLLSYGEPATTELIQRMRALGIWPNDLQAKVFGGSEALGRRGPGNENVVVALSVLAHWGVPLRALDVAGPRGRKLIFDTSDGSVLVSRL